MTDMVYGSAPARDVEPIFSRWWRSIDRWSFAMIFVLFGIGLLLCLAASVPLAQKHGVSDFYYVQRQAMFGLVALIIMSCMTLIDPHNIRRLAVLGFVCSMIALILLPFLGTDFGKGAVRWYSLGFAAVQPSEFLKPAFIVTAAWMMSASEELNGPNGRLYSFGILCIIIMFLAAQPDFGQASLIAFSWGVMYFVAGAPIVMLSAIVLGTLGAGVLFYNSNEHFARRIDGYLDPNLDPTTQLGYATNAIREGGIFGVGVGEGRVKWLLPDAHTDFVIAVAAEEYGLILVMVIIALYCAITIRSLWRLVRERDHFIRFAGTGLACAFAVQAFINMGVAVRLLPAKGMTLPFVSYGGSSIVASAIGLGALLALTRTRPQSEISDIFSRRV